jgi:hypothetical protein
LRLSRRQVMFQLSSTWLMKCGEMQGSILGIFLCRSSVSALQFTAVCMRCVAHTFMASKQRRSTKLEVIIS